MKSPGGGTGREAQNLWRIKRWGRKNPPKKGNEKNVELSGIIHNGGEEELRGTGVSLNGSLEQHLWT